MFDSNCDADYVPFLSFNSPAHTSKSNKARAKYGRDQVSNAASFAV